MISHFIEKILKTGKKLLNLIKINKDARHKINIQKSVAFLYTNNKTTERERKKTIPFIIASKTIKCLKNKFNQHGELYIH